MKLVDRVFALAAELREAGVPVSVAETQDALLALTHVPLSDRRAVRAALGAALAKEPSARAIFIRLFDVLFPPGRTSSVPGNGGGELPEELDVEARLGQAITDMDVEGMRELARRLVDEEAHVQPGAQVSDEHYRYRALRHIDLEDLLRRIVDEDVAGKGLSMLDRKLVEEDFEERMRRFSDEVAEEIRMRRRQGRSLQEQLAEERRTPPEEVDFIWATDADLEAMRRAIAPLARRLALRMSHRRRAARRGRLDLRRTLRRSLSTGGTPANPAFKKPHGGRPELWVLCDISGSMRAFARFTLELLYALSTQFSKVRSFVFIDAIDEVTGVLDSSSDLATALARIDDEADVVALDGQSWYGNCLEQFHRRFGRELSPRATLLILGDARNNNRTSGTERLREIGRNVRRVWWLNPEPRRYWDTADSIASEFAPNTDGMIECRNLEQLENFVAKVL